MTDQNGFGTSSPPSGLTWQSDNGAYTFGQRFKVTTTGLSVTKIRFYLPSGSPSGATSGYYVGLYAEGDSTALATAGPFAATVGAWNEFTIATTAVTSGAGYVAAVLAPGGYYGASTTVFASGDYDPSGDLYFYSAGRFHSGSSLTYPTDTFGTPWYGVDVVVSDGAGSNTVDVAGTAPAATGNLQFASTTVAVAGTAPAATGALTFAATTVAVAGTAPAATGALVFARPISIAADGVAPAATGALVFRLEGETEEAPGSWYGLLDISREYRMRVEEGRHAIPVACPNDGEPLRTGPRGELYCPFDGWRY